MRMHPSRVHPHTRDAYTPTNDDDDVLVMVAAAGADTHMHPSRACPCARAHKYAHALTIAYTPPDSEPLPVGPDSVRIWLWHSVLTLFGVCPSGHFRGTL